jgi:four helix bundle protein
MQLAKECYLLTRDFPRDEIYGQTSQIGRAAVSAPANVAEGYGRDNRGDYVYFLRIAQGSLKELETHLLLSVDVELIRQEGVVSALSLCDQIGRMLRSLIRKLQELK